MPKFNKKQFLKSYTEEVKGIIENNGKPAVGAGRPTVDKLMAIKRQRTGGK